MEIKYEAVFGPQHYFDKAPKEATHATQGGGFYRVTESGEMEYLSFGPCNGLIYKGIDAYLIAERRIIRTPTWTVADQKAGKLPPVGSRYLGKDGQEMTCVLIDAFYDVWGVNEDLTMFVWGRSGISPIESPEEKAARVREEWCESALKIINHKFIDARGPMAIYDALLTGDLPVPVKGE